MVGCLSADVMPRSGFFVVGYAGGKTILEILSHHYAILTTPLKITTMMMHTALT